MLQQAMHPVHADLNTATLARTDSVGGQKPGAINEEPAPMTEMNIGPGCVGLKLDGPGVTHLEVAATRLDEHDTVEVAVTRPNNEAPMESVAAGPNNDATVETGLIGPNDEATVEVATTGLEAESTVEDAVIGSAKQVTMACNDEIENNTTIVGVVGSATVQGAAAAMGFNTPLTKRIPMAVLSTPLTENVVKKGRGKENAGYNPKRIMKIQRKSSRIASRPKTDLTMEEQATMLLMKKYGTLEQGKKPDEANHSNHSRFRETSVEPLHK